MAASQNREVLRKYEATAYATMQKRAAGLDGTPEQQARAKKSLEARNAKKRRRYQRQRERLIALATARIKREQTKRLERIDAAIMGFQSPTRPPNTLT